jgi:hypothetical protein
MAFDRFWTPNEPVPSVPSDNYQPALVVVGDALHLVWSSNRVLYHIVRSANAWSSPVRIAAGEQPSLAATPDGQLHCVFANPFVGNWEIYHVAFECGGWSLPKPVSRTSGVSIQPALAAAVDGSLHAVWADNTPGDSVVYHGTLEADAMWSSAPIPSGRGCLPTIAATGAGDICVAWQDRTVKTETFDVYCSLLHERKWSLPDMVSDSAAVHSVKPWLAATLQGGVHLVWLEEKASLYSVRHSDRRMNGWSQPVAVSTGSQDCRQARIVANPQSFLQVVWLEGNALHHRVRPPDYDTPWWIPQTAEGIYRELSDLSAAIDPTGKLHVVWSGFGDGGARSLYYALREAIFKPGSPKPGQ